MAKCQFLELPPELRLLVYRDLLDPSGPRVIFSDVGKDVKTGVHLQILRTCSQVYREALPCLYGSRQPWRVLFTGRLRHKHRNGDLYDAYTYETNPKVIHWMENVSEPRSFLNLGHIRHVEISMILLAAVDDAGADDGTNANFYFMTDILDNLLRTDNSLHPECAPGPKMLTLTQRPYREMHPRFKGDVLEDHLFARFVRDRPNDAAPDLSLGVEGENSKLKMSNLEKVLGKIDELAKLREVVAVRRPGYSIQEGYDWRAKLLEWDRNRLENLRAN